MVVVAVLAVVVLMVVVIVAEVVVDSSWNNIGTSCTNNMPYARPMQSMRNEADMELKLWLWQKYKGNEIM